MSLQFEKYFNPILLSTSEACHRYILRFLFNWPRSTADDPDLMPGFLKEAIIIDVYVWNVMITTIQQLGADKKQEKI